MRVAELFHRLATLEDADIEVYVGGMSIPIESLGYDLGKVWLNTDTILKGTIEVRNERRRSTDWG